MAPISRIGVYGVAAQNEKILLIRAGGFYEGKWYLPGGGIEFGETPEEALMREFEEELGMGFTSMQLIKNTSCVMEKREKEGPFHHIALIYEVEGLFPILGATPQENFCWMPFAEVKSQEVARIFQEIF